MGAVNIFSFSFLLFQKFEGTHHLALDRRNRLAEFFQHGEE